MDEDFELQISAHGATLASRAGTISIRDQLVVLDDLHREAMITSANELLGAEEAARLGADLLLAVIRSMGLLRLSEPERFDLAHQERLLDELLAWLF